MSSVFESFDQNDQSNKAIQEQEAKIAISAFEFILKELSNASYRSLLPCLRLLIALSASPSTDLCSQLMQYRDASLLSILDSHMRLGSILHKRFCFQILANFCRNSNQDALRISSNVGLLMRTQEAMHARKDIETVNEAN